MISNLERVVEQLKRWGDGYIDGAFEGQVKAAKEIMELARDTYCPIDTGDLRSTAHITAELREAHLSSVDIVFGGNDSIADYAVYVHERLDVYHEPPTQAKYLERAVNEKMPDVTLRIGEGAVAGAVERSGAS